MHIYTPYKVVTTKSPLSICLSLNKVTVILSTVFSMLYFTSLWLICKFVPLNTQSPSPFCSYPHHPTLCFNFDRFCQHSSQRFYRFTNFQQCMTVCVSLPLSIQDIISLSFLTLMSNKVIFCSFICHRFFYSFMNHVLYPLTIFIGFYCFLYWLEKFLCAFWILIFYHVYILWIFSATCLLILFVAKKLLVILICNLHINF